MPRLENRNILHIGKLVFLQMVEEMQMNCTPMTNMPLDSHSVAGMNEEQQSLLAQAFGYIPHPIGWIHPSTLPVSVQYPSNLTPSGMTKAAVQLNWRKGKWFEEEEAYTKKLIEAFNAGQLPLPSGTTLRSFLSEKLNCDPMRITKKFAGSSCIGKQVYTPSSNPDPASTKKLYDEISILEEKFQERVEAQRALECHPLTTPHAYFAALQQHQLSTMMRDSSLQQEYLSVVAAQHMYFHALMKCYNNPPESSAKSPLNANVVQQSSRNSAQPTTVFGGGMQGRELTDAIQPCLSSANPIDIRLSPSCILNFPEQNVEPLAPRGTLLSTQVKTNLTCGVTFDSSPRPVKNKLSKNKRKRPQSSTVNDRDGDDIAASDLLLNFFQTVKTRDESVVRDDLATPRSEPSTDGEEQLSVADDSLSCISRSDSSQSFSYLDDATMVVRSVDFVQDQKRRKSE